MRLVEVYRKECSILKSKCTNKINKVLGYAISILIWLLIWHFTDLIIDKDIFLPYPLDVFKVLINDLLPSDVFWSSILHSVINILLGFLLGTIIGVLLASVSSMSRIIKAFLWFPIVVLKSVPVASFVILLLLWVVPEQLSIVIPMMVVIPILYINTLSSIEMTDKKIIEMADLYKVPFIRKLMYIYVPSVMPAVISACSLAIGMAWKSGIAAEIIGLAKNTIGNELYKTKIYLMTTELFGWTFVIILLSILCEYLLKKVVHYLEVKGE